MGDNNTTPIMNDFFVRGVPVDVAREAIDKWDTLTDEERQLLGFTADYSPLAIYLQQKQREIARQTNLQCVSSVLPFDPKHPQ